MESKKPETLIHGIKLSSVGPGRVTGQDVIYEPTNMDLAMKLHYLRVVYYFSAKAAEGLTTLKLKEAMFTWFNPYFATCGRFKRDKYGRPYIKCNDCGARFVDAECARTVDEWLEIVEEDEELHRLVVPNQVIGPELSFSPLIFIQVTRFRCGGISLGLSWSNVLGDAFCVVDFMNSLGHVLAGHNELTQPLKQTQLRIKPKKSLTPITPLQSPLSVKRVGPVGDHWINATNLKMKMLSFNLTHIKVSKLQTKVSGLHSDDKIPAFQSICAVIWKVIAKIRNVHEPKRVTICKMNSLCGKDHTLGNHNQVISTVKAEISVMEASAKELSGLLTNQAIDDRAHIDEAIEREDGLSDFVIYGTNLTFVDLEDADFYGFELNGRIPVYSSCIVDGVGEEGLVLVLPRPKVAVTEDGNLGKVVNLIMPADEISELKSMLKSEFSIA